jgi:ubiquinone/menaquinone biosynthesis C-methylase UbiE
MTVHRHYLPAAGHDWFLPLYDPFTRLLGMEQVRGELVSHSALQPLQRVLDIGCGTGALTILIKQQHPAVDAIGLDPDPKALARAERKALRASVAVRFDRGFSEALPYADASIDRVFSSMMFHHLELPAKQQTLEEIRRVLVPGGRLHLLDFLTSGNRERSRMLRWIHSHHQLADNGEERVLGLMRDAGLAGARKVAERRMVLGTLAFYVASRPM